MDLGNAIKEIRKKKNMSQQELAMKVRISVNALSLIETNVTWPQNNNLNKICEALGINKTYLLFFSIDASDIPDEKKEMFEMLHKPMKDILLSIPEPKTLKKDGENKN